MAKNFATDRLLARTGPAQEGAPGTCFPSIVDVTGTNPYPQILDRRRLTR